jgi:hypothetical protein
MKPLRRTAKLLWLPNVACSAFIGTTLGAGDRFEWQLAAIGASAGAVIGGIISVFIRVGGTEAAGSPKIDLLDPPSTC